MSAGKKYIGLDLEQPDRFHWVALRDLIGHAGAAAAGPVCWSFRLPSP